MGERRSALPGRLRTGDRRDALLDIIGIGESSEPTDFADKEQEYLADAYLPSRR
jgi:hypothetical protein